MTFIANGLVYSSVHSDIHCVAYGEIPSWTLTHLCMTLALVIRCVFIVVLEAISLMPKINPISLVHGTLHLQVWYWGTKELAGYSLAWSWYWGDQVARCGGKGGCGTHIALVFWLQVSELKAICRVSILSFALYCMILNPHAQGSDNLWWEPYWPMWPIYKSHCHQGYLYVYYEYHLG